MSLVSTTVIEHVAVLLIDNPPVNMGNAALRQDLLRAITELETVPELLGAVIGTAGKHFYAGSDISEFDRPLSEPQLPAVIEALENLSIPVVAAITGLALGGGLEFALGCDARIGDSSAVVGFPEVTLGILPGAGGCVRSARLMGAPLAIDLIASARQLDAETALSLGLLDRVVGASELLDVARELAATMGSKNRLRDRVAPVSTAADTEAAAVTAAPAGKTRPNIVAAVQMVRDSVSMGAEDALLKERELFHHFRRSDESSNLRYLFFAKRAAAKAIRYSGQSAKVVRVGVAGAGTMGLSLARMFAAAGFSVTIFDTNSEALTRAKALVPALTVASELSAFADVDLVIEAVFEEMAVKQDLFARIEEVVAENTVLASNTSYLDLDEMSSTLAHPERFAGLHFFNPAEKNPLVELIRPAAAGESTMATLGAVVARLGKTGIPAGIGDGFVANRVYTDYRAQAEFLVEDGAAPEDVDAAMVALGMAIGPFAVSDMSGLDIAWARRKRLASGRDPLQRYVTIPDSLCELGRLGKKTGAGWYDYPDGGGRGTPAAATVKVITDARVAANVIARDIDEAEIQLRVLCSMLCAAAGLLQSGIAERASDIDVALTEGFAFPRWLGGPLRLLSRESEQRLIEGLAAVYSSCPVTFGVAEPASRGILPVGIAAVLRAVRPAAPENA